MNSIALILVLAITVEAMVEYTKALLQHDDKKGLIIQLAALLCAVALCCAAGADIYNVLSIEFSVPYAGCVLTGIFASRGANYASDIVGRLNSAAG